MFSLVDGQKNIVCLDLIACFNKLTHYAGTAKALHIG